MASDEQFGTDKKDKNRCHQTHSLGPKCRDGHET